MEPAERHSAGAWVRNASRGRCARFLDRPEMDEHVWETCIPADFCLTEDFGASSPLRKSRNDSSPPCSLSHGRVCPRVYPARVFFHGPRRWWRACARLRPSCRGSRWIATPSAASHACVQCFPPARGVTVGPERDPGIHIQESHMRVLDRS